MTDKLIFKSLGVSNFSKYVQAVEDVDFEIQIDTKYNVLPLKEKEFEEIIEFDINYSNAFKSLITQEIKQLNTKSKVGVLYLSSTSTTLFTNPLEDEIEILHQVIQQLKIEEKTAAGFVFYIKFHPKDTETKKIEILNALKKENVYFWELSKDTVYPVEALFGQIEIVFLFGYGSSAQLYSEVINPNIISYNLFYNLKESYSLKNDKNTYPSKSWENWESLFFNIFKKSPRKFNLNEKGRHNL